MTGLRFSLGKVRREEAMQGVVVEEIIAQKHLDLALPLDGGKIANKSFTF